VSVADDQPRDDGERNPAELVESGKYSAVTEDDVRHLHEQFEDAIEQLQMATVRVREIAERQRGLSERPRRWTEQERAWLAHERSSIELLWRVVEKERALVEELRKRIIDHLQHIDDATSALDASK
jgi:DNA-binding ferritin-like protein